MGVIKCEKQIPGYVFVALFVIALNFYALYQCILANGYIFYVNGHDEESYLLYRAFGPDQTMLGRFSQFIVANLHELGISGGWINLIFDFICPTVFIIALTSIFEFIKFNKKLVVTCSIFTIVFPLVIIKFNPCVTLLGELINSSELVKWVALPLSDSLPLARTPEPQFTWMLTALAVYLALRIKNWTPIVLVMPLSYYFVAIPMIFVVSGALVLTSKRGSKFLWMLMSKTKYFNRELLAILIGYLILAAAIKICFSNLVDLASADFLLKSHLPIFSFTGVCSIAIYLWIRIKLPLDIRSIALIVACAPLASVNQQILSGIVVMPSGIEQYFGTMCVALLLCFAIGYGAFTVNKVNKTVIVLCLSCLTALWSYKIFVFNLPALNILRKSPGLVSVLRERADDVAIDSPLTAMPLELMLSKQSPTIFSFSKQYKTLTMADVETYLCVKNQISHDPKYAGYFKELFDFLDERYSFDPRNLIYVNLKRREIYPRRFDPHKIPNQCKSRNIYYVLTGSAE